MTTARALAGRRVLELADEKGVYCGKLLADMGADVVKIERPGGDATRGIPPFWGDQPHSQRSLFFLYTNTSKRGVTLDLRRAEGQGLLERLVETADLVRQRAVLEPLRRYIDDSGPPRAASRSRTGMATAASVWLPTRTSPRRSSSSSARASSGLDGRRRGERRWLHRHDES